MPAKGATAEGNAYLARWHRENGTPKAEFAALMSVAGYCTFDEALDLWDTADSGRNLTAENGGAS